MNERKKVGKICPPPCGQGLNRTIVNFMVVLPIMFAQHVPLDLYEYAWWPQASRVSDWVPFPDFSA